MRRSRLVPLLASTLAVVTVAACGSSAAKPAAAPAPAKLALIRGAGDEARAALYPVRPVHYVLDGALADLGADAPVYRLVGATVTEADVVRIAGVLGMHAAPTHTEWGYEVRDGDALLNIETNGGVTWLDYSSAGNASNAGVAGGGSSGSSGAPDAPDVPDKPDPPVTTEPPAPRATTPPPVDVPNADDAARIAQNLLDTLGVVDGQQWAHNVSDTSNDGVAVACADDTPCPPPPDPVISARNVSYALVLDGAQLPDVGWNVTVGSHGAVEALSGTWAKPERAGTYPLRSTADVLADLQHDRAQYVGPQPLAAGVAEIARDDTGATGAEPDPITPQDVHVTGVSAGRARWDGADGGEPVVYILPTYRFRAQAPGQPSYDVELLALDPASFTIAAPAPVPTPESTEPAAAG
jgi:hypothetical protein